MVKVLFLDIDSCLNWSPYGECLYHMDDRELQNTYWNLAHLKDRVPIVDDNLAALQYVINEVPDLRIVWTTDWRFHEHEQYECFGIQWRNPKQWLETLPWISERVIGSTPKTMSGNRHEEIQIWLHENDSDEIADYAILDDCDTVGMRQYSKHFFKCDPTVGLTNEQADKIIAYLKTDDFNEKELDWENT